MNIPNYDEIRQKNIEEYGKGSRHLAYLSSDLYATRTHFLYELLQNSEDALGKRDNKAEAGYVEFNLHENCLDIRHNGKPFDGKDVTGICGVGEGTKAGDFSQIGKFGIGFKSVYAYTLRPRIHSNEAHFEVRRFVEPHALPRDTIPTGIKPLETCIVLPFDSGTDEQHFRKRVPPDQAVSEIGNALKRIGLRSLLFLRFAAEIRWSLPDNTKGTFLRETRSVTGKPMARYVEVTDGTNTETWLVFRRDISVVDEDEDRQVVVEIAFLVRDEKVIRAKNTELVVYFPTEKKTELGFLIQGPFKTTMARDNIADESKANQQMIETAAQLAADSLEDLRDMGLLQVESYKALPLQSKVFQDDGARFFMPVYQAVREALKYKALLPRDGGGYVAPNVARLARGSQLAKIFSPEQLGSLFGVELLQWLDTGITEDQMPELRDYLAGRRKQSQRIEWEQQPLVEGIELEAKNLAVKLTASFFQEQDESWLIKFYEYIDKNFEAYRNTPFVRIEDETHVSSDKASLPPRDSSGIDRTVFMLVKQSLVDKQTVLEFLREKPKLKPPDAVDVIVRCLLPKYEAGTLPFDAAEYERDLQRIGEVCNGDGRSRLLPKLQNTKIIACILARDPELDEVTWKIPNDPAVFCRTAALVAWFEENHKDDAWFIHTDASKIINDHLCDIVVARKSPLQDCDPTVRGMISLNDSWGNHRRGLDGFNPRARILGLDFALTHWNLERALYLWSLLLDIPHLIKGDVKTASNANKLDSAPRETIHSILGDACTNAEWLPDKDRNRHKSQNMCMSDLPDDFEKLTPRAETLSRTLGMKQPVDLAPLAQAWSMTPEQLERRRQLTDEEVNEVLKRRAEDHDFPDKKSPSPDRRREKVMEDARTAPRKTSSLREQSVQDGYPDDKAEAKQYLRGQYTAQHGNLFCQLGHTPMPFKLLTSEEWHFEAVECVPDTHCRYPENFLALSPHFAALFKYANRDRDLLRDLIRNAESPEIQLRLANETYALRFTSQHLDDLKAVLNVDAEKSVEED